MTYETIPFFRSKYGTHAVRIQDDEAGRKLLVGSFAGIRRGPFTSDPVPLKPLTGGLFSGKAIVLSATLRKNGACICEFLSDGSFRRLRRKPGRAK